MNIIKRSPATQDDFERILFVCKARKKGTPHVFKEVVHVEETKNGCRLIATDGKRLHIAEINLKIKTGDYKPQIRRDVITMGPALKGIKFPDWQREIPEKARKRVTIDLSQAGSGNDKAANSGKLTLALHSCLTKAGEIINLRYLDDLPKKEWAVCKEQGKPLLFKQQNTKRETLAVIVPMRAAA
jgi:hypothetical protein